MSFAPGRHCSPNTTLTSFASLSWPLLPQDQPSSYKTKVCRSFSRGGRCPYGARCRFVHGDVVEAQQLAMLRLMDESPSMKLQLPLEQSQSQPASPSLRSTCPPCVSSTCPPTPLLGPFAHSSPLPAGPLDLSSHSGAVRLSASPLQQAQQAQLSQQQSFKPGQPQEDSRTCSSYASSLFSSSHYSSPQLTPVAMPQPSLLSTHQTSQHTPLGPAWQEHANGPQEWSPPSVPWHSSARVREREDAQPRARGRRVPSGCDRTAHSVRVRDRAGIRVRGSYP